MLLKQQKVHLKKDLLQDDLRMAFKKTSSQPLDHDVLGHQCVLLLDLDIVVPFRFGRD